MGLTYEEAKSLGIAHLHPLHSRKNDGEILREKFGIDPGLPGWAAESEIRSRCDPDDGMNKTERSFAAMLDVAMGRPLQENRMISWRFEAVKFRLAGRTWYTPDFWIEIGSTDWPGEPARSNFVEIKGFFRDDAAVKIKVAADLYPQFRWLLAYREGGHGWDVREVNSRGIGTSPIHVPWIEGS